MRANSPTDVFQLIDMRGHDECWPFLGTWGGRAREKRPYFMASGRRTMAYRIVWELVNGPIPEGMLILHSCDNGGFPIGCCNPLHLRTGTVQENSNDMVSRQRHGLPRIVVRAILSLLDRGVIQQEIADLYGISREAVSAIATGRSHRGEAAREDRQTEDLPTQDRQTPDNEEPTIDVSQRHNH